MLRDIQDCKDNVAYVLVFKLLRFVQNEEEDDGDMCEVEKAWARKIENRVLSKTTTEIEMILKSKIKF